MKGKKTKALKAALPWTIPVMLGYLFVGMAFGMLFESKGYHFLWAVLMSVTVYAGSMQFLAVSFFVSGAGFVEIALMTFMVNFRHSFYGLSMIEKFKHMGKKKPYMIFSLTDETYSLLCSLDAPPGVDQSWFFFFISFLNQIYWVIGSLIGSVAGSLISFNTKGIDFAMVALFVVIVIEQWKSCKTHIPTLTGFACALVCLVLFGPDKMAFSSMLMIAAALLFAKQPIEKKLEG